MLKYASEWKQLLPGFDLAEDLLAWANYLTGNLEQAEYHWENIRKTGSMHSRHRLAFVMMQNGQTEAAEKVLLERMHFDSTYVNNNPDKLISGTYYDLAICNAFLENKEEAYFWMEKAMEDDIFLIGIGTWWINHDPMWDNLRGEARFEEIRTKFNEKNDIIAEAYQTRLNELEASEELKTILR